MDPIFLTFFGFHIRWYGLMYALGMFAGYQFGRRDLAARGLKMHHEDFFDLILYSFMGGLIGGRLYYVAFNWDLYFGPDQVWWEFLAIWHGGLAIHGGLILGPLTLWMVCKFKKVPFIPLLDLLATHMLLAQALGRIGNFMNGDAHGTPTRSSLGVTFTYGPAAQEFPGIPTHPVMLYELVLNVIGWAILYRLRKEGYRAGFLACLYVLLYAGIRSIVTGFRADDLYLMGIRAPYVISGLMAVVSLAVMVKFRLYEKVPQRKK